MAIIEKIAGGHRILHDEQLYRQCPFRGSRSAAAMVATNGDFLLAMILPVLGHGTGLVSLGPDGWPWLGSAISSTSDTDVLICQNISGASHS